MKGWRARQEQGASSEVPGITRRTLARSTAWAAPVLVTAVAAPAYAASGPCVAGMATLTETTVPANPKPLAFSPSTTGVTATATFSSTGWGTDATPGDTSEIHRTEFTDAISTYGNFNYLKLHHDEGMDLGDTITLTITFSRLVTGLTLTITDIDKDTGSWIDHVIIGTPGYTVTRRGQNVIGAGTASGTTSTTGPFRSSVEGGVDSIRSDVTLTWSVQVREVVITYRAADSSNASAVGQHIGVGKIGFAC